MPTDKRSRNAIPLHWLPDYLGFDSSSLFNKLIH